MTRDLPSGTVTFLFTDIEGSTRLLHELGDRYAEVLGEHRRLLRQTFGAHGGVEVDTQGDAFFIAFPRAQDALAAAAAAQGALEEGPVRVRMGIHTGEPVVTDEGYVGMDVHRGARVMSAGHGGQVLVSETTQRLCGESGLIDLGPQRLKDLTEPQHLYQLGAGEFPPLKSLNQTNLPLAGSPLVGREAELGQLLELLRDGSRVVTITGTGGTGKTRLALQAAAELVDEFKDGVFWVPLAGLRDPELVLASVAQALGAREELASYLTERETLLVLDNFEHLLAASAPLAKLLSEAPQAKALVTSRAPLHVDGEQEFPLDPLAEKEGVTLFLERARAAGRRVEADDTVAEICRRLDNLPLALELAAARTKLLSPPALLARLEQRLPLLTGGRRDAPERQQTLRATIEWSYELLESEARQLFARLAVFAGSFSIQAAEKVCDADLDTLAALVDLSLLKPIGEDRFLMLETIREYGLERLGESAETKQLRERYAHHFAALAEEARPHLRTEQADIWLERLADDHANFGASIDYLVQVDVPRAALAADGLDRYWDLRGHLAEGQRRLDAIISAAENSDIEQELLGRVLNAACGMRWSAGDFAAASNFAEQALSIARERGDERAISIATHNLGSLCSYLGDLDRARALVSESLELAEQMEDEDGVATSKMALGFFTFAAGETAPARELLNEALSAFEELGTSEEQAVALCNIGLVDLAEDKLDAAHASFVQSLSRAKRIGALRWTATATVGFAAVAARRGQDARAAQLLGAVESLLLEIGAGLEPFEDELRLKTLAEVRARLGDQEFSEAWAQGQGCTPEEMAAYALSSD